MASRVRGKGASCNSPSPASDLRSSAPSPRVAGRGKASSPLLHPRPQIELMGPGAARLAMQHPVILGDRLRVENAVVTLQRGALGEILADPGGVDRAVDHNVRHVNALG